MRIASSTRNNTDKVTQGMANVLHCIVLQIKIIYKRFTCYMCLVQNGTLHPLDTATVP